MSSRRLKLGFITASVALGALVVLSRKKAAASPDAFPFPTQRSHDAAPVDDDTQLAGWAEELQSEPAAVRAAADVVGKSRVAIADYLKRR